LFQQGEIKDLNCIINEIYGVIIVSVECNKPHSKVSMRIIEEFFLIHHLTSDILFPHKWTVISFPSLKLSLRCVGPAIKIDPGGRYERVYLNGHIYFCGNIQVFWNPYASFLNCYAHGNMG